MSKKFLKKRLIKNKKTKKTEYTYNNNLNKINSSFSINSVKVNKAYKYVKIIIKFFELIIIKRNKNYVFISASDINNKNNVTKKKKNKNRVNIKNNERAS